MFPSSGKWGMPGLGMIYVCQKKGFGEGLWCLVGDFNAVLCSNERRGVGIQS